MKTSTIIFFVGEILFATFMCLSLLLHAWVTLATLMALVSLLWMGKPWIRQPVTPRSERWLILCFIAPLAIVAFVTIFFPSLSISDSLARVASHPVFVSLLWVFWLWQIVRQWRREKSKADA